MTLDAKYLPPPVPDSTAPAPLRSADLTAMVVSEWVRDRLWMISGNTERAQQHELGPSEIGAECPRRLAFRITGTPVVNMPDPLRAMFGTGIHAVIGNGLARQDRSRGRFLIEHAVSYRGIPGHVDLDDRVPRRMIDWKSTMKKRIVKYRQGGVPTNYVVQAQIYAAGLAEQGEEIDIIALVFIPRDGLLPDVWTWTTKPDRAVADKAIDRYESIAERAKRDGPASLPVVPSNLCGWCPNYRPNATDLSVACPGKDQPR